MNWSLSDKTLRARLVTGIALLLAILAVWVLWNYYMVAPWTRDGRVRAEVVRIAPEVSGTVLHMHVADNQFVKKGDLLFSLDPERFRLALAHAEAVVAQCKVGTLVRQEERQQSQAAADVASAALLQAEVLRDVAKLNLERSVVRSPANGYVTNLTLRAGDFANAGVSQLSIIDSDSFYVVGYFEETKLIRVHPGARVSIYLMQGGRALQGRVLGISHGITDLTTAADTDGLAKVNPVFAWVRLAQRIPVRISIDQIPENVHIAAGLTCTVTVIEEDNAKK
ncbi:MAG: biotin/lipoyl-binding protein [Candidatus Methylacidiphilales bacterium]|nr:biotin/lipoyl-binding protein [Candidatus Methylacidiphilales bacterium]